jgi:hypothetical protein
VLNAVNVQSFLLRLTQRLVALPRGVRILLAGGFAVALTLLVTPLAYNLLRVDFFVADSSKIVAPTLIALVSGLVLYGVGWRLMIGYAGETPSPNNALLIYFVAGILICGLALILVVVGAISGTGT